MPMDFPDLKSLVRASKTHGFRNILKDESEEDFRGALADHVVSIDFIESEEIRNKVGWDRFTAMQNSIMLKKAVKR